MGFYSVHERKDTMRVCVCVCVCVCVRKQVVERDGKVA